MLSGELSLSDLRLIIEGITSATTLLLTVITVILTVVILRHTAKPNIEVTVSGELKLRPGQEGLLRFHLSNVGHWYGSPPATNIVAFVNANPAFTLNRLRYGSDLELKTKEVKRGVGPSKYLRATGIVLFKEEPAEDMALSFLAPEQPGTYEIWVSVRSEEGGHTSESFEIHVVSPNDGGGLLNWIGRLCSKQSAAPARGLNRRVQPFYRLIMFVAQQKLGDGHKR